MIPRKKLALLLSFVLTIIAAGVPTEPQEESRYFTTTALLLLLVQQ